MDGWMDRWKDEWIYIIHNILYFPYKGEPSFDETYFDKLVNELVEVVEERDNIIQQVEMDRVR